MSGLVVSAMDTPEPLNEMFTMSVEWLDDIEVRMSDESIEGRETLQVVIRAYGQHVVSQHYWLTKPEDQSYWREVRIKGWLYMATPDVESAKAHLRLCLGKQISVLFSRWGPLSDEVLNTTKTPIPKEQIGS